MIWSVVPIAYLIVLVAVFGTIIFVRHIFG